MRPIDQQVILVTGATSGLGRALAEPAALHALVNNAGIGSGRDPSKRDTSRDGIELRMAVNHLAGALLIRRLLPRLQESAPARIVQVASLGQAPFDPADPQLERRYDGWQAYMQSKLAQVMLTRDLAGELDPATVTINALHPATFMATDMVREGGITPQSSVDEGLRATLRLLVDPELDGVSGRFFDGTREVDPNPAADDPEARAFVRTLTEKLLPS